MSKQTILNYESSAASLNSEPGKRGPYKRGPKSTETASVVGVYEDAPAAIPPMPKLEDFGWRPDRPGTNSGRGSFETKAQEDAYNAAFNRHVAAVNSQVSPLVTMPKPEDFGWEDADPLGGNGGGGWQIEGGEEAYYEALDKAFGRPQGPMVVPRNNVPNRYDRGALADFITDLPTLGRAQKHFDRITSTEPPMSVKGAFRLMLITYCDE